MKKNNCAQFLQKLPKAELHVHIEGTLEPAHFLLLAKKNKIVLPIEQMLTDDKKSYRFSDFSSFIQTYAKITQVLCTQQDFHDVTIAYLEKVHQQGVVHAEIYFDIQTYAPRNIDPDTIVLGIHSGLQEGLKKFGISSSLIFSILGYETEQDALTYFQLIHEKYPHIIRTIGLAADGDNNPITKFKAVFNIAHTHRYHCVAHVGEFGHPELIWQALREIPIERIDHGIACVTDESLMQELAQRKIPLTICPLSNVKLNTYEHLYDHPIKKIYDAGVVVTINSDDPSFFKSYVGNNYQALFHEGILSCKELVQCARNSIHASFVDQKRKDILLAMIRDYIKNHSCS